MRLCVYFGDWQMPAPREGNKQAELAKNFNWPAATLFVFFWLTQPIKNG